MNDSQTPARLSELQLRIIVGLALIGVASTGLVLGGVAFWVLCVVLALLMMGEWANLAGAPPQSGRLAQFALSVPLAIMAPHFGAGPGFLALGLLAGAAFFVVIVTRRPHLAVGLLYAGLPVMGLMLLRGQREGAIFTLWALALVWMCDIGAYFAGRAIGGPKLAPAISPNKTWAGLAGGVVAASLFGAAMHWQFGLPWRLTLATPALAALAQGGDLYESWLKRRAGVKDSGNILPGHGGVLDRLDGLVPVAPVAALLAVALPKLYHLLP
ncbi:phosphatidate cytidylyltransferase [Sphingomonas sp. RT2P30]|uniref:phosphatidate cytidylyltransferase n=1 Tax=Parasphingomonas halimpatiens TaxID=3096162 RepID=UPI002FCA7ECD